MNCLFTEAITIGLLSIIIGIVVMNVIQHFNNIKDSDLYDSDKMKNNKRNFFFTTFFVTGILIYLFCEFLGVNDWYCKKKCRTMCGDTNNTNETLFVNSEFSDVSDVSDESEQEMTDTNRDTNPKSNQDSDTDLYVTDIGKVNPNSSMMRVVDDTSSPIEDTMRINELSNQDLNMLQEYIQKNSQRNNTLNYFRKYMD